MVAMMLLLPRNGSETVVSFRVHKRELPKTKDKFWPYCLNV